jgi:hypothetical protein
MAPLISSFFSGPEYGRTANEYLKRIGQCLWLLRLMSERVTLPPMAVTIPTAGNDVFRR